MTVKSLILMYVYYDRVGEIKAITPTPDFGESFNVAMFPIGDVEMFLTGQRNPFEYQIKEVPRASSVTYKIVRKQTQVLTTRTLDNYLTKVSSSGDIVPILRIVNDVKKKTITLKLDPYFIDMYKMGTDEEQEDVGEFIRSGESTLYFTSKDNPYHMYYSIRFLPRELFEKEILVFEYGDIDLSNASVYTKKIVKTYGYLIKGR